MKRQNKISYTVKARWLGRNTSINKKLVSGKRRAEYSIELFAISKVSKTSPRSRQFLVIENWGIINKASNVSVMCFSNKRKALEYFEKEVSATISRGYRKVFVRKTHAKK